MSDIKLYDNQNTIKILWGTDELEQYVTKLYSIHPVAFSGLGSLRNATRGDYVSITEENDLTTKIYLDDVSVPSVADLDALVAVLANFNNTLSGGGESYSFTFTNADLTAGVLSVNHALNTTAVGGFIYDPSGVSEVVPMTIVDANNVTFDFGGAIGAGTFSGVIIS